MPRGFSGKSVEKFFRNTSEAMEVAGKAHARNPFEGQTPNLVPLPHIPEPRKVAPAFTEEDAWRGSGHARNAGDSSNVVVDHDVYSQALQMLDVTDYQAGADLYAACGALEEMCANTFVVPETVARIMNVTGQFKSSLGQFRSLTEETNIEMRKYTTAISDIDHGSARSVAMSRTGTDQAIQRVSMSMDRQINDMERTAENYKRQSAALLRTIEHSAGGHHVQAAMLNMPFRMHN